MIKVLFSSSEVLNYFNYSQSESLPTAQAVISALTTLPLSSSSPSLLAQLQTSQRTERLPGTNTPSFSPLPFQGGLPSCLGETRVLAFSWQTQPTSHSFSDPADTCSSANTCSDNRLTNFPSLIICMCSNSDPKGGYPAHVVCVHTSHSWSPSHSSTHCITPPSLPIC